MDIIMIIAIVMVIASLIFFIGGVYKPSIHNEYKYTLKENILDIILGAAGAIVILCLIFMFIML